jgi:predicted nucleic acid-binding protein
MARYLADTNVLLRLSDTPSPQNPIAAQALARLFRENHSVFITAQNILEFWAVATRPLEVNGLGWSPERTRREVRALLEKFPLLPDHPDIFANWIGLVENIPVVGKRVHDARLVAVMRTNDVEHLLTFNSGDFSVFPRLSVIEPQTLVGSPN